MKTLIKRTISGAVFVAVLVFGTIWDRTSFFALYLYILLASLREFYGFTLRGCLQPQKALGIIAGMSAFVAVTGHAFFGWSLSLLVIPALLTVLIAVSALLLPSCTEDVDKLALIYAGLGYIALPVSLSPLFVMEGEVFYGWPLLCFFIIIWLSDTGAYCLGTAFGQKPTSRKLAPSISPKKSWVGFWSALGFGVAAGAGLHLLGWMSYPLVHCCVLGLLIGAGSVVGDLFESMWKRRFDVKDSGNVIPGHGGILDRFDSSLIAIPLAVCYLCIFGLI